MSFSLNNNKNYVCQGFVLQKSVFIISAYFDGNLTKTFRTMTDRRAKHKLVGLNATEPINNDTI